ncbi:hypothetical protein K466DRAFT_596202 [Polyporus arcularius HHB13444]|uniref:F-box domain-containing protein n=1 Tax=Polyporus arcularius HHB13444 TaxID=1314778 RepID=A0A5C3PU92_9APHY|nr:hypothetical protein K466DRAFT_596202 [Polyporus arcularius HHB13444]
MPHFHHLSVEDQALVCSRVDMRSMMTLRACSRRTLSAVASVLRFNLRQLCKLTVPKPDQFFDELVRIYAFIGGEMAVRWMLRDFSWPCNHMHVFVPALQFANIGLELTHVQHSELMAIREADEDEDGSMRPNGVERIGLFYTPSGFVTVYESTTDDPLAPIACLQSSVEVAYVNPLYFGHGYPTLLFAYRGLLAGWAHDEREYVIAWAGRGVELRLYAEGWPEYGGRRCPARSWACPAQGRRFTDGGALRGRINPCETTALHSGVIWRLDVRPCGGECLGLDSVDGDLAPDQKFVDEDEWP